MEQNNNGIGFTLIELSIVLVIIGLIVGGVLVGRDLINAAAIRAQISQIEELNSSVNTFKLKYNALPGDMDRSRTSSVGLFTMVKPGWAQPFCDCWGDNNGYIEAEAGGIHNGIYQKSGSYGETLVFWRHLFEAGLITGEYGRDLDSGGGVSSDVTGASIANFLPPAKYENKNYIIVASVMGKTYYLLTAVNIITSFTSTSFNPIIFNSDDRISPIDAYSIDSKIDDGKGNSGSVRAEGFRGGEIYSYLIMIPNSIPAACVGGTSGYNLTNNTPSCSLRINAQF